MDNNFQARLLTYILRAKGQADITVTGVSMNPSVNEGDYVTITTSESYEPGDILAYTYKDEGLLLHRLLRKDKRYYCKGDNALRMEDISAEDIIGKVIAVNSRPLPAWPQWKLALSLSVNRQFHIHHFDKTATMLTDAYQLYAALILRKGDTTMLYHKNDQLDYIPADKTSLAVFDPESGSTCFFDETGIDILNALEEPCTIDTLLDRLCRIYDASPEDIREDVEEFLADAVQKKVVILA